MISCSKAAFAGQATGALLNLTPAAEDGLRRAEQPLQAGRLLCVEQQGLGLLCQLSGEASQAAGIEAGH